MLAIRGAMDAVLDSALFWGALAGSLIVLGPRRSPLNRWLILKRAGHGIVHAHH
jgi:hypothetical protein